MDSTRQAIAAVFPDSSSAHAAIDTLEAQGFARPWMAVTRPAEGHAWGDATGATPPAQNEIAESSDGVLGAIGRFFSGEGNSLRRSLEDHGIEPGDAERIDASMTAQTAVVVISAEGRLDVVEQIVRQSGGSLSGTSAGSRTGVAGASGLGAATGLAGAAGYLGGSSGASGREAVPGSSAAIGALGTPSVAQDDATTLSDTTTGRYGATAGAGAGAAHGNAAYGDTTASTFESDDETRRLQLREERLQIDKQTVSAGEVTIGKRVETEHTSVDVPVFHEEIFIERRPLANAKISDAPIDSAGETIHVPLSREEVRVDKTAFVREEVAIGKRRIEETQHVEETVRREVLDTGETTDLGSSSVTGDPLR